MCAFAALREKQLRYFRCLEGGKKEPEEEESILQSQLKPELGPAAEQEQEVLYPWWIDRQ